MDKDIYVVLDQDTGQLLRFNCPVKMTGFLPNLLEGQRYRPFGVLWSEGQWMALPHTSTFP